MEGGESRGKRNLVEALQEEKMFRYPRKVGKEGRVLNLRSLRALEGGRKIKEKEASEGTPLRSKPEEGRIDEKFTPILKSQGILCASEPGGGET